MSGTHVLYQDIFIPLGSTQAGPNQVSSLLTAALDRTALGSVDYVEFHATTGQPGWRRGETKGIIAILIGLLLPAVNTSPTSGFFLDPNFQGGVNVATSGFTPKGGLVLAVGDVNNPSTRGFTGGVFVAAGDVTGDFIKRQMQHGFGLLLPYLGPKAEIHLTGLPIDAGLLRQLRSNTSAKIVVR
jgi:hypothetical protein